jgi:predicted nucleic acid-binding protein
VLIANFPVVLDACVLYPAALRDTLLRAAEYDLYTPYWSAQILDEVCRNLIKNGRFSPGQGEYLVVEMTRAFPDAAVVGYEPLIAVMENEPKDRHVLAAAVKVRAQVIVTANLLDFPESALAGYTLKAKSPDDFLLDLLSVDSVTMLKLIREQLADLRTPGATMDHLLAALTKQAPGFAETLRLMLNVA